MANESGAKKKRHMRILELIESKDVETQEDLTNLLRASGFEVTQATVSRDIRDLQLAKTLSESGVYKYRATKEPVRYSPNKYTELLCQAVTGCELAVNLVVIKTFSGMASAAAAAIDHLGIDKIVGSIAGDDTVFLAAKNAEDASELREMLLVITENK